MTESITTQLNILHRAFCLTANKSCNLHIADKGIARMLYNSVIDIYHLMYIQIKHSRDSYMAIQAKDRVGIAPVLLIGV